MTFKNGLTNFVKIFHQYHTLFILYLFYTTNLTLELLTLLITILHYIRR